MLTASPRWTRFVLITIVLVEIAGATLGQGGPVVQQRAEPEARWRRVVSRDRSFAIQMPGNPVFQQKQLRGENGRPVAYTSYTVDLDTRAYAVSYGDYDAKTKPNLEGAASGFVGKKGQSTILSRRTITLFGHDGRFLDFIRDGYRIQARLVRVGQRIYQIVVTAKKDRFEDAVPEFFLNSFWLQQ